jgi:hypothetical protein
MCQAAVVLIGLAVLANDRRQGVRHLGDVLSGGVIEGFLNHGLFGTASASKRALQCRIGAQTRIDLNDAVGTGEDGDESIVEFVGRRILHGFLRNLDGLANRLKQIQGLKVDTDGGQAGTGRAVLSDCATLIHDGSPIVGWRIC